MGKQPKRLILNVKRQIMRRVLISTAQETLSRKFSDQQIWRFLYFSPCSWGRKWKPSYRSGIITCAPGGATIFHWLRRKNLNDQRLFMAFREAEQFSNSASVGIHVFVCMCVRTVKVRQSSVPGPFWMHHCQIPHLVTRWGVKLPGWSLTQRAGTPAKPIPNDKLQPRLKLKSNSPCS